MLNKKALAATAAADKLYVEDVFSTYLYTGNGSTQTITNGIDLSGEGGLVWVKERGAAADHTLVDTVRGAGKVLFTNSTSQQINQGTAGTIVAFGSNSFDVKDQSDGGYGVNGTSKTYASWTFRKAEKFFDVVTYTGNGTAGRTVSHNLGSVPGCIIVKRTDSANGWPVYHRAMDSTSPQNYQMRLNATDGRFTTSPVSRWNDTAPTSTTFTLSDNDEVNGSGATYVAYLFAHDAGGFGDSGSESVIKCGSFTTDSNGNATVNLGWEPQWVMIKRTDSSTSGDWYINDNMRNWPAAPNAGNYLRANSSGAEVTFSGATSPNATGFSVTEGFLTASVHTFVYIAIRRGPMKTPEAGTEVFEPTVATVSTASNTIVSSGSVVAVDMTWTKGKNNASAPFLPQTRLTGGNYLQMSATSAESSGTYTTWDRMSGTKPVPWTDGDSCIDYAFRRAPGFFDVVCYTGNGTSGTTQSHNLGVTPELMIIKGRTNTDNWGVGLPSLSTREIYLNLSGSYGSGNTTVASSTTFTLQGMGGTSATNASGEKYVAYLFATCPGVSKVGSYTGTGTTLQVNCGFTGGARFVMIKRTDSTGDWYVWDTARGIVSGNDPYLLLNSTAAEVTNTDYIDTYSQGFEISSTAPAAINANGGTFIFLAIA